MTVSWTSTILQLLIYKKTRVVTDVQTGEMVMMIGVFKVVYDKFSKDFTLLKHSAM